MPEKLPSSPSDNDIDSSAEESKIENPESSIHDLRTNASPHPHHPKLIKIVGALGLIAVLGLVLFLFLQNQALRSQLNSSSDITCEYNGQVYQVGESFKDAEDCNTCFCNEDGQVGCTEMACLDEIESTDADFFNEWEIYSTDEYSVKYPTNWEIFRNETTEESLWLNNRDSDAVLNIIKTNEPLDNILLGYCISKSDMNLETFNSYQAWSFTDWCGIGGSVNSKNVIVDTNDEKIIFTIYKQSELTPQELKDFDQILSTFEFNQSQKESVVVTSPAGADVISVDDVRKFQVQFTKPSDSTSHELTNEPYQRLNIFDESFEITIMFPTDGGSSIFEKPPDVTNIFNSQLGDLQRISSDASSNNFSYSNNFESDCQNWEPKPAGGCGLMQVGYENPQSSLGTTYFYIGCKALTSSGAISCDEVVTSLSVEQIE